VNDDLGSVAFKVSQNVVQWFFAVCHHVQMAWHEHIRINAQTLIENTVIEIFHNQLAILSPGKNIDPANNSKRYEKSAMRVSFVFF